MLCCGLTSLWLAEPCYSLKRTALYRTKSYLTHSLSLPRWSSFGKFESSSTVIGKVSKGSLSESYALGDIEGLQNTCHNFNICLHLSFSNTEGKSFNQNYWSNILIIEFKRYWQVDYFSWAWLLAQHNCDPASLIVVFIFSSNVWQESE